MSEEIQNKRYVFGSYPENQVSEEQFKLENCEYPGELQEGEVFLKLIYLSVDPYMRARMHPVKNYFEVFEPNKVMNGGVICEIISSKNTNFAKKEFVIGFLPWILYQNSDAAGLQKLPKDINPSYFLGALGMPGISAFLPLFKIGQIQAGQTIFISGAAGAVGQVAGQVCKHMGLTVIGCAGSEEKCKHLKEIGYDHVINYKTENVEARLGEYAKDGLDVYFDNVGGKILDAAFLHMKHFGRIISCGQISNYDTKDRYGLVNAFMIVTRRLRMEGFICSDWMPEWQQAQTDLIKLFVDQRLKIFETTINGFENVPKAFIGLFKGDNLGKMIVKI